MKSEHLNRFIDILSLSNTRLSTLYGTSECQVISGCHLSCFNNAPVPIGRSIPGAQCLLIDEQGKVMNHKDNLNDVGEMYAGGKTYSNRFRS